MSEQHKTVTQDHDPYVRNTRAVYCSDSRDLRTQTAESTHLGTPHLGSASSQSLRDLAAEAPLSVLCTDWVCAAQLLSAFFFCCCVHFSQHPIFLVLPLKTARGSERMGIFFVQRRGKSISNWARKRPFQTLRGKVCFAHVRKLWQIEGIDNFAAWISTPSGHHGHRWPAPGVDSACQESQIF